MKIHRSMSAGSKRTLLLYTVVTAVLSLLPISSQATVFWDDEMEPGNTEYATVMPSTGSFDTSVKFSGSASLREHFDGSLGGGFEDRSFPATSNLWGRFYIRLSPGFLVSEIGTKLMRSDPIGQGGSTPSYWWWMPFGRANLGVAAQNYPQGDTTNLYSNMGNPDLSGGIWHCVEIHIQNNTAGQANGMIEAWKNGVQVMGHYNLALGGANPIQFASNRMYRQLGLGDIWYDRVAMGNSRIGCLGSVPTNDSTPPAPPSGLFVR